jgi:predicted PurR-regulated permease PerM
MLKDRFYVVTLLFLLGTLGYLTYEIMSPFFTAIAWSIVISIIFYPLFAFISRNVRIRALAAAITIILILIVLIGPITYLTLMLIDEVQVVAARINDSNAGLLKDVVQKLNSSALFQKVRTYTGAEDLVSEAAILENVKKLGGGLLQEFSSRIPNILAAAIDFIFVVFTTFFLLKDGPGVLSKAKDYMPFSEAQKERLAGQIKDMIVSTVYGGVVVAIIQGILGGMAYAFIGIEAPVIWGMTMSVMSFVPLVGAFAIWGPTSIYLIIEHSYTRGIGLFLFGIFVISMVDNILKPLIIGSRTKMPTIIILFSVLGGIKLFGVIGLIMGPLITAVFISVFEIFRHTEDEIVQQRIP